MNNKIELLDENQLKIELESLHSQKLTSKVTSKIIDILAVGTDKFGIEFLNNDPKVKKILSELQYYKLTRFENFGDMIIYYFDGIAKEGNFPNFRSRLIDKKIIRKDNVISTRNGNFEKIRISFAGKLQLFFTVYKDEQQYISNDLPIEVDCVLCDINKANKMAIKGNSDNAMDLVFNTIDDLLLLKKFNFIDMLLKKITISDYNSLILIGILSITLGAKDVLKEREKFYNLVEEHFNSTGQNRTGLLDGLK